MRLHVRTSLKAGPFRFTASSRGIGVSAGVPGFRVGTGPRGNWVRVAGHGVSYSTTRAGTRRSRPAGRTSARRAGATGAPQQLTSPLDDSPAMSDTTGAGVLQLTPTGPGDLVEQLNTAATRHRLAPWAVVAACVLAVLTGAGAPVVLLLAVPVVIWLILRDRARRRVVAFYDVQAGPAQWYEHLLTAFGPVRAAQGRWRIVASGAVTTTHQHKRNAGASAVVSRRALAATLLGPHHLVTNIDVPSFADGDTSVHLLPDRVLVRQGRRYSDVSYEALRAHASPTRFIEDGRVPRDATQVGTTWRYVNVKGGPDRRYKDNRQLPIMQYGHLRLSSAHGLDWRLDISHLSAATGLGAAITAAPATALRPAALDPISGAIPGSAPSDAPSDAAVTGRRPPQATAAAHAAPARTVTSHAPPAPGAAAATGTDAGAAGDVATPAAAPAARGYAVVDLETTGLSAQHHRIVEVAVVHVDPRGRIERSWTTLINPHTSAAAAPGGALGADAGVGATRIHGITAADVAGAPAFADVAAPLVDLLTGRVLVAHNASFDLPFLAAEFARAGVVMPAVARLCTLSDSRRHLPHLTRRKLADCCTAAQVQLSQAHTALGDATATAGLLACYLNAPTAQPRTTGRLLRTAASTPWPPVSARAGALVPKPRSASPLESPPAASPLPAVETDGRVAGRGPWSERSRKRATAGGATAVPATPPAAGGGVTAAPGRLAQLLGDLPLDAPELTEAAGYLEVLAEALADGVLTEAEVDALVDAAAAAGLSQAQVQAAHHGLLTSLARAAVADGVVTSAERAHLVACADALELDALAVKVALGEAQAQRTAALAADLAPLPAGWDLGEPLRLGDGVVFTGGEDPLRTQLERRTRAAGLRVVSCVSGRTAVLVTDDITSGTAKARRAMELGTRVLSTGMYMRLLDHVQPAHPAPLSSRAVSASR